MPAREVRDRRRVEVRDRRRAGGRGQHHAHSRDRDRDVTVTGTGTAAVAAARRGRNPSRGADWRRGGDCGVRQPSVACACVGCLARMAVGGNTARTARRLPPAPEAVLGGGGGDCGGATAAGAADAGSDDDQEVHARTHTRTHTHMPAHERARTDMQNMPHARALGEGGGAFGRLVGLGDLRGQGREGGGWGDLSPVCVANSMRHVERGGREGGGGSTLPSLRPVASRHAADSAASAGVGRIGITEAEARKEHRQHRPSRSNRL